jgi:Concanavalin A-like lectin/glucanases superfamily
MCQSIQFKSTSRPVRYFTSRSPLRWGFSLISVVLLSLCLPVIPMQAQTPKIFAADNPSGTVSSGGANIAYLQNTTQSDVALILDGNTIINRANRLNIFDKSSGSWVQRVILNQQSQPISIFTTANTFLTGLYAYFKLDEASGAALDSRGTRNLANYGNPVGTTTGKINTSRNFPGGSAYFSSLNTTDFSPGSNHFFFSFWAKAGNLTQGQADTGFLSKTGTTNNRQWIVFYSNATKQVKLNASIDDLNTFQVVATTTFANTTTWYFIAGGWDGTNIKISVNGGPYAATAFAGPVAPTGSYPFTIGLEMGSGGGWFGQIDEVAVWIGRNDLTISEVQQLYNNGAGLPFSSFH